MTTNPWLPAPATIAQRIEETADTFTLTLELGDRPPRFAPGQFNMLYAFGVGEVPISISGDPDASSSVVHTIRTVGTVTSAIARLGRGAQLGIRGPYGSAWPVERAVGGDLVVIAGGLGLAPLRPVIYRALRQRERFRRFAILYGARSPSDRLYAAELASWRGRGDVEVVETVDHAPRDGWLGPVGVVPALIADVELDPARAIALICGPEVMMRFSARALALRGVPADRVYVAIERNMKCALGLCGHCQYRETFACTTGPIVRLDRVAAIFDRREI